MPVRVIATANFKREAKPLLKRYRSLRSELAILGTALLAQPASGEPLGQDCYKIRVAIASKGQGKSGGARVITYRRVVDAKTGTEWVFLLSIYDKSEVASIGREEIRRLLMAVPDDLSDE